MSQSFPPQSFEDIQAYYKFVGAVTLEVVKRYIEEP